MELQIGRMQHEGKVVRTLVLLPTKEESELIDVALGMDVVDDTGLISRVQGEVGVEDGYGRHYIVLHTRKAESPEGSEACA